MPMILFTVMCGSLYAEEKDGGEIRYDYVTDTAKSVVDKAAALLTGNLDIQAVPETRSNPDDYTRDAIGRRVPKSTAAKSAQSMHSDLPL